MELMLNNLFKIDDKTLSKCKIELNMTDGAGAIPLIEKWLKFDYDVKINGTGECSYWTTYANRRNFREDNFVYSFVRMDKPDEWLFVSAARIINAPMNSYAEYEILEELKPFFGRLIIKYKKGNTFSRYVFNFENIINDCVVKEILSCPYDGEQFKGYDSVFLPYRQLNDIFKGKIMRSYNDALQQIKGVYCLTNTENGKLYIGSAYGSGGVYERWGDYLNTKHGDNKKLILLHKEKGEKYFEENFTFTLLEYYGMHYDENKILQRENYWKDCLNTRKNGYNGN